MQWRQARSVGCSGVTIGLDCKFQKILVAIACRVVGYASSKAILALGIGSVLQEHLCHSRMPTQRSPMERGTPIVILGLHVCSSLQQPPGGSCTGYMQRALTPAILQIQGCSSSQQFLDLMQIGAM
jgi:hypothetical protein